MKILVRNSNRLLVSDRRRRVMMHSGKPPTYLFQQVTKLGDCSLPLKKLIIFGVKKSQLIYLRIESTLTIT